jgi:two-component system response regulator MtrA
VIRVLLADDDPDLREVISVALGREGFAVMGARDGVEALDRWRRDDPDVVLLDVRLPHKDGFEVCQAIRQDSRTPVILLTAVTDERHIVRGFTCGADDYVTKPFSCRQLAMRIRAIHRRYVDQRQPPATQLIVGDLILDLESHELQCGDRLVRLTPREYRIFYRLALNCGHAVSFEALVDSDWSRDGGEAAPVRTHVAHLRQKLRYLGGQPSDILAVPDVGYRLPRRTDARDTGDRGRDQDVALVVNVAASSLSRRN